MSERIKVSAINADPDIQGIRRELNKDKIKEYQEIATLDPVTVMKIDSILFLVDGFHRMAAMVNGRGWTEVEANIEEGKNLSEAYARAVELNTSHGVSLTREEKHKACLEILAMTPELSNRHIAKICGVSQETCNKIRYDLEKAGKIEVVKEVKRTDGKTYKLPDKKRTGKRNITSVHWPSEDMSREFLRIIERAKPLCGSKSLPQILVYMAAHFEATMLAPEMPLIKNGDEDETPL